MKPLAVFAMPKDRNKVVSAGETGNRGSKKGVKKPIKGQKKGLRRAQAVMRGQENHRLAANSG